MPQLALASIIEQIHHAPPQLVYEFAGAGSRALTWLHSVGGSSRTVLEASERYSTAALRDLLGTLPPQIVAPDTARQMAVRAYERARALHLPHVALDETASPLLGVACTATIATNYAKRGNHRAVVAVQQATGSTTYDLIIQKGLRERADEEDLVSRLVLHAIASACAIDADVLPPLAPEERVTHHYQPATDALAHLLAGECNSVTVQPDGTRNCNHPVAGAILSGSFNPLHHGHTTMATTARMLLGMPVTYELPVINADKGHLISEEIERRVAQFRGVAPLVLSRAPLFVDKAELFPGCVFVMGYDTAIRLVTPRYYQGEAGMHAAFARLRAAGCRLLVAGRVHDNRFATLQDIALPAAFRDLFIELPEPRFRVDISSTALRQSARTRTAANTAPPTPDDLDDEP